MKIEKIKLNHLVMPLISHFETSFGRITTRDCIIIQIFSNGLIGLGECVADHDPGYAYETSGTAWHILSEFLIPAIIGKSINTPEEFRVSVAGVRGHFMAKAGLEMALWDLIGKSKGRSLKELIKGEKNKIKVGVSVGLQDSLKEVEKVVNKYILEGYERIKLKIKPGCDVKYVQHIRNVFPEILLQADANSAYSVETANNLLELDPLNLLMIEQPLYEDDLWEHHKLQKLLRTAICLDESIISARHARAAIEMEACRIINIKAGRVGGLSEAIAVHDYCKEKSIPNWCGGMLETGIGRASNLALASLPNINLHSDISATNRYYVRDITNEEFKLNADSTINVPVGNGLGVTVNEKTLKTFTIREQLFEING
jgi:o-succinylbenzoate synthase